MINKTQINITHFSGQVWVRHACHRAVKGFKAISRTLEFHHHQLLHKQVANGKTKGLWPKGGCPAKMTRRAQLEWEQKICSIAKASLKVANINGNEPTVGKTSNKQRVSCRTPRKEAAAWQHHCMTEFGEKTTLKLQSGIGYFFFSGLMKLTLSYFRRATSARVWCKNGTACPHGLVEETWVGLASLHQGVASMQKKKKSSVML